ncbi:hypothetical protein NQ314_018990 [Rhamnusium bicolor]|uniref:RING-type E3 ubiquitin transferase n=1 Tax=Rhamnusium bicolor TaxID=1586634 RepID=A0AAV8WPQ5_9CUCU|nr:hypothetical protein NQ314_018990 [Rhamnusium bicolor]
MTEALEKSLLEDLQCPVCDSYMCPPIRQCQKGHSICDHCFPKLKVCPKCRSPKSQARSFALEAIHSKLKIPCRYAIAGCNFVSLGEHIRNHECFCKLAPKSCPFRNYDDCHWKDITSKLKSHLMKKHSSNFYQKEKQRFLSQNFRNITNYHYIYVVIHAHKDFFRLTWDIDEITGDYEQFKCFYE